MLNDDGKIFAWQHDAEVHGHGIYTVFDNEAAGAANTGTGVTSQLPYSRAVTREATAGPGRPRSSTRPTSRRQHSPPRRANTQLLARR